VVVLTTPVAMIVVLHVMSGIDTARTEVMVVVRVHVPPLVVMIVDMVAVHPHATTIVVVHLVVIMTIVREDEMTVVGMIVRTRSLALLQVKQVTILVPGDRIGLVVAMYGCRCHISNVLFWRGDKLVQALSIRGNNPLCTLFGGLRVKGPYGAGVWHYVSPHGFYAALGSWYYPNGYQIVRRVDRRGWTASDAAQFPCVITEGGGRLSDLACTEHCGMLLHIPGTASPALQGDHEVSSLLFTDLSPSHSLATYVTMVAFHTTFSLSLAYTRMEGGNQR
jgi:hypothetical protein